MSTTISVADDVYEWMKEEKKDRSFSEFIRSLKSKKSNFKDFNGENILKGSHTEMEEIVEKASEESIKDLEE